MQLVIGVAVVRDGRVLAARRAGPPELAGCWEFPGGKVEPGEAPEATAVREIAEELGCVVRVTGWFSAQVPVRDGLVLRVARAELVEGEPVPVSGDHDAVRWLAPGEAGEVAWLPPDLPFVAEWVGAAD